MDLSSAPLVFFVLPLVLVPLVAWWGWCILPPSITVAPPETQDRKRQLLIIFYLCFTVVAFVCSYSIMMENAPHPFRMVEIFGFTVAFSLGLALLALLPRPFRFTNTTDRHFMRHLLFIVALIACMTLTCVGFQSGIHWQQSMARWSYDFEYYGAARITGQRYSDQDDGDEEQADGNDEEDQRIDLWTSVQWMCPSYGTNGDAGTLCQQELASICPDGSTNFDDDDNQWMYTNFYQVRVYNADDVEEECDANLMDLVNTNNNDDDGYDSSASPQNDGSPYLYIVANCTNGCSAGFASAMMQSDYKQSRLGLRMGYGFLGLSVIGLFGLVGMTVYRWRRQMSVENNDAGVELLPSAQGEVT